MTNTVEATLTCDLKDRVCGELMSCLRSLTLYPRAHPRVTGAIANACGALEQHFQETGAAFVLTSEAAGTPKPARGSVASRSEADFTLLLAMNVIDRLVVRPGVEADELVELCLFLQDESALVFRSDDFTPNPDAWRHVELEFYELQHSWSRRAANGMTGAGSSPIASRLGEIAEAERARLAGAMEDGAVRLKLAELRQIFVEHLPDAPRGDGEMLDVVGEVFREVLAEASTAATEAQARSVMLEQLDRLSSFFNANLPHLDRELNNFDPTQGESETARLLARALTRGPDVSSEVGLLEDAKHKLSALFRTEVRNSLPVAPAGEDSGGAWRGKKNDGPPAEAIESVLERAAYDVAEMEAEVARLDVERPFVHALLETLVDDQGPRKECMNGWGCAKGQVLRASSDRRFLGDTLRLTARYLECDHAPEVSDLALSLLEKARVDGEAGSWLQTVALYPGGVGVVKTFVDGLVGRDAEQAVRVLAAVDGRGNEALQDLVRRELLGLSQYPALFTSWMANYPSALLEGETLERLVAVIGLKGLMRAFRRFFGSVTASDAERVLKRLPSGFSVGEQIVYAAIESGAPAVRELGILELERFPSRIAFDTLKEIVRLNNCLPEPRAAEVEAAVASLCAMSYPGAGAFLHHVCHGRSLLRHEFRREIRSIAVAAIDRAGRRAWR